MLHRRCRAMHKVLVGAPRSAIRRPESLRQRYQSFSIFWTSDDRHIRRFERHSKELRELLQARRSLLQVPRMLRYASGVDDDGLFGQVNQHRRKLVPRRYYDLTTPSQLLGPQASMTPDLQFIKISSQFMCRSTYRIACSTLLSPLQNQPSIFLSMKALLVRIIE